MNQNIPTRKKRSFVATSLKFMIAVASVAGTVGLWGVFSKKDVQATTTQTTDLPMPVVATLIPVNTVSTTTAATTDTSLSSLPVVSQPAIGTNVNTNSNVQLLQPAPVTTTRSSRK
jgi:hypothetical protein